MGANSVCLSVDKKINSSFMNNDVIKVSKVNSDVILSASESAEEF